MQRQNIIANTKASLLKGLCVSISVPVMLISLSAIFGTTSASAQKLTANILACNESAQARYECYTKVQKDSQVIAEKRISSLKSQKKLRQSLYLKKANERLVKSKEIFERRRSALDIEKNISMELYFKNLKDTLEKSKAITENRRSALKSQKEVRQSLYLKNINEALEKSKAITKARVSIIDSQKQSRQEVYFNKLEKAKVIAATRKSNLDSQKQIRQEDYFKEMELQGSLENAKELGATRKSILEEKEKLRLELSENIGKQREKEHQEIMQQVEYSRSRNISHKGEKYSLTYGYVLELGP